MCFLSMDKRDWSDIVNRCKDKTCMNSEKVKSMSKYRHVFTYQVILAETELENLCTHCDVLFYIYRDKHINTSVLLWQHFLKGKNSC